MMNPCLRWGGDQIRYWRQGQATQNFGDFLAQFLYEKLFLPIALHPAPAYLIGSVVADFLIPTDGEGRPSVVFWGCGARDEQGLSAEAAERALILAVRGPLSASALRLGEATPQGDPALLLPALYSPNSQAGRKGRTTCIPHFWDSRSDADMLAMSGCEQVLRPNLPNSRRRLLETVDVIAASDFVLSASLHGAIVAAAYGRPFAFWDNGHLDLPFKWRDTAALLGIPLAFVRTAREGHETYEREIAPTLRLPPLSPLLFNAPFPLRVEAALRVLAYEGPGETGWNSKLTDWSRLLAGSSPDVDAAVGFGRKAVEEAERLIHGAESAVEAAKRDADEAAVILASAEADAREARGALTIASTQREQAEARANATADRLSLIISDLKSRLQLSPDLTPDGLGLEIEQRLDNAWQARDAAHLQLAELEAELKATGNEIASARGALAKVIEERDEVVQQLSEATITEVRLRETLRSAIARREYEERFVVKAKEEHRGLLEEIGTLRDQQAKAVLHEEGTRSEMARLTIETHALREDVAILRAGAALSGDRLGELAEVARSEHARCMALEAELASLKGATTLRAVRWAAKLVPLPDNIRRLVRSLARALAGRSRGPM